MQAALTRFCPTLNGPMHLGHLWCAFYNWAYGADAGVILRFEDMTAQHATDVHPEMLSTYAQDYREQFARFGIPIQREVWQGVRKVLYEECNRRLFHGTLNWDISLQRSRAFYGGEPIPNWGGESPYMAQLSRVMDDHDYYITYIIRGCELGIDQGQYELLRHLVYGCSHIEELPVWVYIPEVYQSENNKISKTISRGYFLKDLELDPKKTLFNLAKNQLEDRVGFYDWQGYGSLAALRKAVAVCPLKKNPPPITLEDLEGWK